MGGRATSSCSWRATSWPRCWGRAARRALFGPQKGADADTVARLEHRLARWASDSGGRARGLDAAAGSGAGGGLGYGLLLLGGRAESGAGAVVEAVDLRRRMVAADLVVTGEGRLDASSLLGKVVLGRRGPRARRRGGLCGARGGLFGRRGAARRLRHHRGPLARGDLRSRRRLRSPGRSVSPTSPRAWPETRSAAAPDSRSEPPQAGVCHHGTPAPSRWLTLSRGVPEAPPVPTTTAGADLDHPGRDDHGRHGG